jgi:hypothetical protein
MKMIGNTAAMTAKSTIPRCLDHEHVLAQATRMMRRG